MRHDFEIPELRKVRAWYATEGSITPTLVGGFAALTMAGGTATARAVSGASRSGRLHRMGWPTAATAGSVLTLRQGNLGHCLIDSAMVSWRFKITDPADVTGSRMFLGSRISFAALTNVDPGTLSQGVGIGHNSGETTLRIYGSDGTLGTPLDLGANFSALASFAGFYDFLIAGLGADGVFWRCVAWDDAVTTGPQELIVLNSTYVANAPSPTYGLLALPNAISDDPRCNTVPFDSVNCPKIDPNFAHDRVPLRAPARAVGFAAVTARSDTLQGICNLNEPLVENCAATPLPRLDVFRGVQAVVALANAQIQVVDLEDPDRNCAVRLGAAVSRAFIRHIPRGGDTVTPPSVVGAPQLAINGGAATFGGANPQLAPVGSGMQACTAENNYCIVLPPQPQDPTKIDPLQVRDATFTLRYEGQLPLRVINAASFDTTPTPGLMTLRSPGSRFCQLGALAGDRVLLTNPSYYVDNNLRGDASVPVMDNPMCPADECRRLFGDPTVRCNREYVIRRASQDSLDIEIPRTAMPGGFRAGDSCGLILEGADFEASARTFAQRLACCYPQATRAEVRVTGTWVVATAPAGRTVEYVHNVVEREGVCVEDPTLGITGRIRENTDYNAGPFRLRIASGTQQTARDTTIVFRTGGGYPQLVSNSGAPGAINMRFLCPADRMYIVDQSPSALREYSLGPFSATRTFN